MKTTSRSICLLAFWALSLLVPAASSWAALPWSNAASPAFARNLHTSTLLPNGKVLVAGGNIGLTHTASVEIYDPSGNTWSFGSPMATPRQQPTATLLANGKVLVVGGFNGLGISSAEIYDPATDTWSSAGSMAGARYFHTATLLPTGKVLVAGGWNAGFYASSAELYDPASNTWSAVPALGRSHANHTATLLPNGKVLIAGGSADSGVTADLYDPVANTWSPAASLNTGRDAHAAILLGSGKVLVVGGNTVSSSSTALASAELYDPGTDTWSNTASLAHVRFDHTLTLLPSGKVLAAGGSDYSTGALATTELYDPVAGTWSATGALADAHRDHTATLLANGRVLVTGGASSPSAELYDPTTTAWSAAGSLATARISHTISLLPNGRALAVGGWTSLGPEGTAELYVPASNAWSAAATLASARGDHTATLLANGKVLVVGGRGTSNTLSSAELYDPTTNTWSTGGSMVTARAFHAATLLPTGKVLVTGGIGTSGTLSSCELYDPITNVWSSPGSMLTARYQHTATLLPNGKVLIAGGMDEAGTYSSAELYDPASNAWTSAGAMTALRTGHRAILLPNGKVLVAGGWTGLAQLASADLYDPLANLWSATGSLSTARSSYFAALLPNGKVLVAGGISAGSVDLASAELYDPVTATWSAGASLATARHTRSATLLRSGMLLVAGGYSSGSEIATAELLDAGLVPDASRRPILSSIGATGNVINPGTAPAATGTGFWPKHEASGGSTLNSATNFPIVQVTRLDNGQTTWLLRNPNAPFTDTNFTSTGTALAGWPAGHVRATAFVNGIPSSAVVALIPPSYSFAYDGNGYDGGTVPLDTYRYVAGSMVTVLGNTGGLARNGHAFKNWNTAIDGSGASYSADDTFTMGSADVTLYAQWLIAQTISFTTGGPLIAYVGGPGYAPAATGGGSGNPVVFTIDGSAASVCTISGGVVSYTGVGTCVINADQAGNSSYAPAPRVQQSFIVGPAATPPTAPTGVIASPGNMEISVIFSGSSSPGTLIGGAAASITQYTATCGGHVNTGSGSPIVVTGLANGTSYTCTVKASNNAGLDSPDSAASAPVVPLAVPGIPPIGIAMSGNGLARVPFGVPGSSGGAPIDTYRITCNPGNHSAYGMSSPMNVAGLTNGNTYTCTAAAHNSAGWSPESAASNPVIPSPVPAVQRAFVAAVSGSDANVVNNCSAVSPCATFATALQVLLSGGEIIATESGEYGTVTLTDSVTLLGAPGQTVAITPSLGHAITIATPGVKVVLRGLQVNRNDVHMTAGETLSVENCVFSDGGSIYVNGPSKLHIMDSLFRNGSTAVWLGGGAIGEVVRSKFIGNDGFGVMVTGSVMGTTTRVVIDRSIFVGTGSDISVLAQSVAAGAEAYAQMTRSSVTGSGMAAAASSSDGAAAETTVSRSRLSGNGIAFRQLNAGAVVYSTGNNTLSGNTTDVVGTLTPLAMQ